MGDIFNADYNSEAIELWDQLYILVRYYYCIDGNESGGNLHIILEDGNIQNEDIQFCKESYQKSNDTLGLLICDILWTMELDTRDRVLSTGKWQ